VITVAECLIGISVVIFTSVKDIVDIFSVHNIVIRGRVILDNVRVSFAAQFVASTSNLCGSN
jgi:hypothetical protein